MHAFPTAGGFFLRLDRGEDLLPTLIGFCQQQGIGSAVMSGIGAVEQTCLGYFDRERREYLRRDFPQVMELISLNGNLGWVDQEPFIHAHAVIAGPDFQAHGGHLFAARIAVTGELMVWTSEERRQRTLDAASGLRLLSE